METAAAATTALAAGIPFAALRVVTDSAWWGGAASFKRHYETLGPRAADTLQALFVRLRDEGCRP
jgi:nucleoside phosphorylase